MFEDHSHVAAKRKLQNREAQRRYRENIKRKLKIAESQMRVGLAQQVQSEKRNIESDVGEPCNLRDDLPALENLSPSSDFDWLSIMRLKDTAPNLECRSQSEYNLNESTAYSQSGSTVLHLAAQKGYEKIVRILLDSGMDITAKDDSGETSLHLAAALGHNDTVMALLEAGVEVDIENTHGQTALFVAVNNGQDSTAKVLL
ncbi:Serine threonine-phosphatase 6 regulatory ankyrin repeat subunit B [Hyphodiscus hymeniophilus]|uniref:Serine threonine-phosphatase 6 regulatory ankyrin repeat subunit B n=1 Tax=Hyphodiscus hymeniophilus TaxID=353542 RepID=A0A9P6VHT1_9HELO|nr:Serine threonine-phosphatase 6 regulatory ankyrin repeat subunit B [Hyphodiscus hymeniophilus]